MQEMQVQSLSWEDHLAKRMATHSSILVWKITQRIALGLQTNWTGFRDKPHTHIYNTGTYILIYVIYIHKTIILLFICIYGVTFSMFFVSMNMSY